MRRLPAPPHLAAIVLGLVTLVAMAVLWPTGSTRNLVDQARSGEGEFAALGIPREFYVASVELAEEQGCSFLETEPCLNVAFRLREGPDDGRLVTQEFPVDEVTTLDFDSGDRVVLSYLPDAPDDFQYQFSDRERRGVLRWITALFVVAVIALGRWRGVAALAGLAASVVVLLVFVLPAIIDGRSPMLVAVVGASAIAYLALYLAHGFGLKTTVALLGTLASLVLTAVLSGIAVRAAAFTGLVEEETLFLTLIPGVSIDFGGLILAGIVLGALGAIDDVTVTQASAVWELRRANPTMSGVALFRSGLRIGRDHIASTVNTLLLAYAGAAMPLLILFVLAEQSLGTIANSEVVAVEIVRTLVGSVGLVAAVPITTYLAARLARSPSVGPSPRC